MKSAGGMRKEAGDVKRAEQTVEAVRAELGELQSEFEREVDRLEDSYDAMSEALEEIVVKAKSTDIEIHLVGLLWMPYYRDAESLRPAWT